MLQGLESNFEYTLNNYLRYFIKNTDDIFKSHLVVQMGEFHSKNLDFKYHCVQAAHKICDMYDNPYLAFSGGIDSQAMLFAFIETKRNFRIIIFRYVNNKNGVVFNSEDYNGALEIVKSLGLSDKMTVLDIDLDHFYTSGLHQSYAERYLCTSPQLTVHMHCLSLFSDPIVMSWNIPNIYSHLGRKRILVPNFKYFSFHRFLVDQKKTGIAYFFIFNPEQFYSSLLLSPIKQLLLNPIKPQFIMPYEAKIAAYQEAGFKVVSQSQKLTGFEDYKEHYRKLIGSNNPEQYEIDLRRPFEKTLPGYNLPAIELDWQFFKSHLII